RIAQMTIFRTPEAPSKRDSCRFKDKAPKRRKIDLSSPTPSPPPEDDMQVESIPAPAPELRVPPLSHLGNNFKSSMKLGTGCFGEVWKVSAVHIKREFALKVSTVDKTKVKTGHNFNRDHLREVAVHKSLSYHPHIVTYMQSWREDNTVYLLMELCEGSVDDYWKECGITPKEIAVMTNDMLRALKHLAASNIGHFDVKPANILKHKAIFKLADFTVATPIHEIQGDREFGEGRYAAPEMLNDDFTLKADIYSLGLSIAQVSVPSSSPLTEEEWECLKVEERLPPRIEQALSFGLPEKVGSMLRRDPASRPSAADLLQGTMNEVLEIAAGARDAEKLKLQLFKLRSRHSLPSGIDSPPNSPRDPEGDEPIFDTDKGFFVMPASLHKRLTLSEKRMPGNRLEF
ncbi:hypothetical protein PMAYCL1PPCAC_21176, partial [Pristionchus mayeri]